LVSHQLTTSASTKPSAGVSASDRASDAKQLGQRNESSFFVYYENQFFDKQLQSVSMQALEQAAQNHLGEVTLGIAPDMSVRALFELKVLKSHPKLRIAVLNDDWVHVLQDRP